MSEKSITRRWTLHICDECGLPGWRFIDKGPCNASHHTHHGKHGGPIEVMPVEEHLRVLGEAERERDEEVTLAQSYRTVAVHNTTMYNAANAELQTITVGLEAEVEHHLGIAADRRWDGQTRNAHAAAGRRLQALLDQVETAGAE